MLQQVAVRDQDLTVLTKLRLGLAPKGCVPFVSAPLNIRIAFALRGNRSNVPASGKHLKNRYIPNVQNHGMRQSQTQLDPEVSHL